MCIRDRSWTSADREGRAPTSDPQWQELYGNGNEPSIGWEKTTKHLQERVWMGEDRWQEFTSPVDPIRSCFRGLAIRTLTPEQAGGLHLRWKTMWVGWMLDEACRRRNAVAKVKSRMRTSYHGK
eukprot:TRINITY_DN26877_c0_g1_i2.p1 TRINITY_DN26877_c0_g1~~TRINITY_DN26877_c0_g1_i2.p1  ORF type:complete len:124 (-),score=20.66 TRINITY_DN26877_c0_g1_i2:415-786(-)